MKKIAKLMTLALAVFVLASCEDVPSPYGTVTPPPTPPVVNPTGDGTATNPFNVTAAINKCKEIGSTESTEKYYVTGVVVTAGTADAQYGNATFTISDEGSNAKFICFQVLGTDGKKMEEGYTFNVGDVVVVYGPMYNYKGNTPETAGKGAAWVVSRNGEPTSSGDTPTPSGDPKGTGTKDDPFNIAAAINKCQEIGTTVSTDKYYVKGYVVKGGTVSGGYGNVSFDMADSKDGGAIFKAFQVAGTDGEKLKDGYEVKAGSEVVVYGPIYNYQGNTPETAGKSAAQIVTIDGKPTSDTGGDTPSGEAKAVTIAEFNAAAESTDVWYQLTGTIKSLTDGDQYGNFDLEDATGSVYVYGLLSEKGGAKKKFQELVAAQGLQAGSKITIIGNRGSYNGKIQVLNAYFVKVEGGTSGGGGDTGVGTHDNPYTVTSGIAAEGDGASTKVENVYIKGFIVGWVEGQVLAEGAHFNSTATVKSNILIAASASETNIANCMPVQLPSGAVRNGINLQDNASFYGKEVLLYGNLEKYFGAAGVKSVSYAEIDGSSFGTKPE